MDILQNIDTNVSSMVSSSFDEFISTKVKEEVEKEKDKFLKDLNMCEDEFLIDSSKEVKILDLHALHHYNTPGDPNSGYYVTNTGEIYSAAYGLEAPASQLPITYQEINVEKTMANRYGNLTYKPVKLNNEYIELINLLKSPCSTRGISGVLWNPLFFHICDIYKKYHPRANENFVVEGKIKKLNDIEEVVNARVSQKVAKGKAGLKKEKEIYSEKIKQVNGIYSEKIKQVNEEKLKMIFSMFILRNERKNNIDEMKNNGDDKKTIREMINHTKERCNQKETDFNAKLQKEKDDFEKEKAEYRKKVSELIDIANDINELNEEQDDISCKSNDIFNIIKRLKD